MWVPVITAIIALAIGLFAGYSYEKGKISASRQGTFQTGANGTRSLNGGSFGRTGTGVRGGAITGKITSADNNSITVQSSDGSSKIVLLSDQTKINKTSQGASSDLQVGSQVMVIGSTVSGTVTAQTITVGGFMPTPTPTTASK